MGELDEENDGLYKLLMVGEGVGCGWSKGKMENELEEKMPDYT